MSLLKAGFLDGVTFLGELLLDMAGNVPDQFSNAIDNYSGNYQFLYNTSDDLHL